MYPDRRVTSSARASIGAPVTVPVDIKTFPLYHPARLLSKSPGLEPDVVPTQIPFQADVDALHKSIRLVHHDPRAGLGALGVLVEMDITI